MMIDSGSSGIYHYKSPYSCSTSLKFVRRSVHPQLAAQGRLHVFYRLYTLTTGVGNLLAGQTLLHQGGNRTIGRGYLPWQGFALMKWLLDRGHHVIFYISNI